MTALLVIGVSESAKVNNVIVFIKVGILLLFIGMGVAFINADNWTPFIPPNEGGFTYGLPGVFRAASVIFFAYVGFEAVSTAAAEAKNPGKDMPIGILGSLVVCTIIYMATAAVLTGIVPYRELGVPAPIALAVDGGGCPVLHLLKAQIAGRLVMLIMTYGQSRIFYGWPGGLRAGVLRLQRVPHPWLALTSGSDRDAASRAINHPWLHGQPGDRCGLRIVCLSVMHLRKSRTPCRRSGAGRPIIRSWESVAW